MATHKPALQVSIAPVQSNSSVQEGIVADYIPPKNSAYAAIMKEKKQCLDLTIQKYQESREYKNLIAALSKAIQLYPSETPYFVMRADAYTQIGDFSSAIVNLRHARRADESSDDIKKRLIEVYVLSGKILYESQLYQRSLVTFEKARDLDPGNLSLLGHCIDCLRELKEFDRCMLLLQRSLVEHPDNPQLMVQRAKMNILFGKSSLAHEDLTRALQKDPECSEAKKLLSTLTQEASVKRNEAIKLSFEGKKEEAVKQISCAIEVNPSLAEYHVFRGSLYRQMYLFNKAQEDFHAAVKKCDHDPDHPVRRMAVKQLALTYNDVAVGHFRRNRFAEAIGLLNQAIDVEKNEKVLYSNRGDSFYRLREYHFALSDYEQALEIAPGDWVMRTRLAVAHCDIGLGEHHKHNQPAALRHFDQAISYNPKVSRFYVCRATARHTVGDTPSAQKDCTFSLILDPDNQDVEAILARVFPGQSGQDILRSNKGQRLRDELAQNIAASVISPNKPHPLSVGGSCTATVKEWSTKSDLYSLDLKVIDSSELEDSNQTRIDTTSDGQGSCVLNLDFNSLTLSGEGESAHVEQFQAGEREKEEEHYACLSPKARKLVSQPLPPIPSPGTGVMPDLKACLKETKFHTAMYYTKKGCEQSVKEFFDQSKDTGSTPPKIGKPKSVKFGQNRTVVPLPRDLSTK